LVAKNTENFPNVDSFFGDREETRRLSKRNGASPIPSNWDIDEVAFPSNRQMIAEQRKMPGESQYPVVA
jgi:hypothetical protein